MASEIEELRARAIASMASSGNPKSRGKRGSGSSREEGELSSSSSDKKENPRNLSEPAAASPSVSVEPVAGAASKAKARNFSNRNVVVPPRPSSSRGKYLPVNGSSSLIDMQKWTFINRSMPQSYQWRPESNLFLSRSSIHQNHGRHMSSSNNDNLVIRFSDNDSGSDSEELEENDKADSFQREQSKQGVALQQVKPPGSHQKGPHNFMTSTIMRVHAANSKGLRNSAAELLQSRGNGVPNKVFASPEHISSGKKSNDNELEILRQKIATKESELKQRNFGSKTMEKMPINEDPCIVKTDILEKMNSGPLFVDGKRLNLNTQENKQAGSHRYDSTVQSEGQMHMLMSSVKPILRYERQEQDDNASRGSGLAKSKEGTKIVYKNRKDPISDTTKDRIQGGSSKQERHNICSSSSTFYSGSIAHATKKPKLMNHDLQTNRDFCSSRMKSTAEGEMTSLLENSSFVNQSGVVAGGRISQDATQDMSTQSAGRVDNKITTCDVQHGDSGQVYMDFQTLMEIEELQDKELEEAQELRRRCEMEERYALRAYRKAQRALMDANERCAYLYQRRELLSAQLQASLMEGHSLWSPGWHKQKSMNLKLPGGGLSILPYLCTQRQADYEPLGDTKSNSQCAAKPHASARQEMRSHNAGSSPSNCPETTPALLHRDTDAVEGTNMHSNRAPIRTHSNNMCTSMDEDEQTFPVNGQAAPYILNCVEGDKVEGRLSNMDGESEQVSNLGGSFSDPLQDALLEASLRSKLFSRLLVGPSSTNSISDSENFDGGNNESARNRLTQVSVSNQSVPETTQKGNACIRDTDHHSKELVSDTVVHQTQLGIHCDDEAVLHDFDPLTMRYNDFEECCSSLGESGRSPFTTGSYVPSAALTVVFRLKDLSVPKPTNASYSSAIQREVTTRVMHNKGFNSTFSENLLDIFTVDMTNKGINRGKMEKIDTEGCHLDIDPFWPLCMFELRGKCNNGQCPYQHVRNYAQKNEALRGVSDGKITHISSQRRNSDSQGSFPDFHTNVMSIPIYLVGAELIKVDKCSFRHVLAQKIWHYWHSSFCSSFTIPFSVHRILVPDLLSLHHRGDLEDNGSRNRLSLYMKQDQDYVMKQVLDGLADPEKTLEVALDLFGRKINTFEGKKKALSILSRSLEANPSSVALWVVYLHIFYKSEKSIGSDDMFLHAVHQNEYSYELWLMFINSRMSISERLEAYDTALSKMCHRVHTDKQDRKYISGCILDLFLQCVNSLCISGCKESAISRIDELYSTKSEKCGHVPIFEIMPCLEISDRCILWVSCIYLLVYGKLPDAVVGRFEFDQELPFGIEWPSIQLIEDDKDKALQLMSFAVDKMQIALDNELDNQEESQIKAEQALAVNHIKCIAALKGVECAHKLIEDYRKLYPTCIELLMMSVDMRKHSEGDVDSSLFEDSVHNWPKGVPGIELVWNQYFGFALAKNGTAFVKNLMAANWFQTAWRPQCSDISSSQEAVQDDGSVPSGPYVLASSGQSMASSYSNSKDESYALLNLALYKLLHSDKDGAQSAIDRAVKFASAEDFMHLVREHASFSLSGVSDLIRDFPDGKLSPLLYGYLVATKSFPSSVPLFRRFLSCIKKARLRHLISNMMGPVSLDFSVLNSILECWYGPSLLPDEYGDFKALVDFVGSLMDIWPANYKLALSICKSITHLHDPYSISSTAALFWASSVLVNSMLQAFPVASEKTWIEAAEILGCLEIDVISEGFYQQAISVYPFSVSLWRCYFNFHKRTGDPTEVVVAAKQRGIELD